MGTPQQAREGHDLGAYLDQHRVMTVATAGHDGLPHAAAVPYRRDGDDLYVMLEPASRTAANLGAVGPVAGTVTDEGTPDLPRSLELSGAAEMIADPAEAGRVAAAFADRGAAGGPGSGWQLYRIVTDELRLVEGGTEVLLAHSPTGTREAGRAPAGASALQRRLEERSAAVGEAIVRQGQPADRFYVILAGECEVTRDAGSGRQVLARLGPGSYFGETGLLAGVPRTATVTALGDVRLLTLSRANFRAALADTAPTAEELARLAYEGARQ